MRFLQNLRLLSMLVAVLLLRKLNRRTADNWFFKSQTHHYLNRDAAHDARRSFRARDFRLYAAMGYSLGYPGVVQQEGKELAGQYGSQQMPGVVDCSRSEAQWQYNQRAREYMARYNLELACLLRGRID